MSASANPEPLYLCLDQGGHSSRALVFDQRGRLYREARRPLTASSTGDGRVEYRAEELVNSLRDCLTDIRAELGETCSSLVAAGLATQRSNIACWDRIDGTALGPIISWQDRRHARWLEQLTDQAGRIHALTGLTLSPHYGASKLRWCLDNLPPVQQAREQNRLMLGPMAAYLVRQLTREARALADPVNASRTQLWSLQHHDWDDELLALFGIDRDVLPPCAASRADFGHLALADLELPLQLVTGDQSAALYAYGPLRTDTAYLNLGTGAFVSRPSDGRAVFDPRLLSSLVLLDGDRADYVLEGTVNGAGAALDWLAQRQQRELEPADLACWLTEMAPSPLLFLNGVGGLAAPYWRADFESRFIGEGTPDQQAVAVMESIVFLLQTNLERMQEKLGPVQQLQVTGGLAHLDGLCRRLADLSGTPLYRPRECEATARGIAYLLAGQPAHWPEPGIGMAFLPSPDPALQQRYRAWQDAMTAALG